MQEWRDDILQGIETVPFRHRHGSLVVFGEHAVPLLHGEQDLDIPLAVAELGNGRICVTTSKHWVTGDLKGVDLLQRNLRMWVSRGGYKSEEGDVYLINKNRDRIPGDAKIIMFAGGQVNARMETDYLEFVERGGGLLYTYPNGANKLNEGKPHHSLPLSNILLKAGIGMTGKVIGTKKKSYSTSAPETQSNVLLQIHESREDVHYLTEHGQKMALSLSRLPSEVLRTQFSQHLAALAKQYSATFDDTVAAVKKGRTGRKLHIGVLHLINIMADNRIHFDKSPVTSHFPGDFSHPPQLQCGEVSIRGQYKEAYPTGFYVPAGQELSLTVTSEGHDYTKWSVQIGAHKDKLHKKDTLSRTPRIYMQAPLTEKQMKIYSAHGGLVYLHSSVEPTRLDVRLENVVAAPYYNKGSPRAKRQWQESRDAPGLWADIAGENIVFTLPSEVVRDIEDPKEMIDYWDDVALHEHELRGSNPRRNKRQWVVADKQPAAGAMHSGYPIVTHLTIADEKHKNFIFNMDRLREHGAWGLFHEIGHNMQRGGWTFEGTREVTNNIFTLYTCEVMSKADAWIHPWVEKHMQKAKQYLSGGANFDEWKKNPGLALMCFLQLAHHFGWQSYKKFFKAYEDLPIASHPTNNQEKMNQWIRRFSTITGFNLCPLFDFWGFHIEDEVKSQLRDLPFCIPDDDFTQLAPHRYKRMVEKYGPRVVTELYGFSTADSECSKSERVSMKMTSSNKEKDKSCSKDIEKKVRDDGSSSGASKGSLSEDEDEEGVCQGTEDNGTDEDCDYNSDDSPKL